MIWFRVRMMIEGMEYVDGIRGRDAAHALSNAIWNWPDAQDITVIGPWT